MKFFRRTFIVFRQFHYYQSSSSKLSFPFSSLTVKVLLFDIHLPVLRLVQKPFMLLHLSVFNVKSLVLSFWDHFYGRKVNDRISDVESSLPFYLSSQECSWLWFKLRRFKDYLIILHWDQINRWTSFSFRIIRITL